MSERADHWRPVVGFEGLYEVSAAGEVRSLDRVLHYTTTRGHNVTKTVKGRLRRLSRQGGYLYVSLDSSSRQQRRKARVSRLVAAAFLGPCPEGMVVRHIDGNRVNDCLGNLRYRK